VASWGTAVSGLQQGLNMGRPFIFVGRFVQSLALSARAERQRGGIGLGAAHLSP
jgi:hypothetical protein